MVHRSFHWRWRYKCYLEVLAWAMRRRSVGPTPSVPQSTSRRLVARQRYVDLLLSAAYTTRSFTHTHTVNIFSAVRRGNCPLLLPLSFWLSENYCRENFLLVGNGSSKNAEFRLKPPFSRNLEEKLKCWAAIISSVGNVQLPVPPTFLTHAAAEHIFTFFTYLLL